MWGRCWQPTTTLMFSEMKIYKESKDQSVGTYTTQGPTKKTIDGTKSRQSVTFPLQNRMFVIRHYSCKICVIQRGGLFCLSGGRKGVIEKNRI